jgi:bacterioferritin
MTSPAPSRAGSQTELAIRLLTDDMRGEHAAIVQYLSHAYAIGDTPGEAGTLPPEIEEIARDEMRHWRWLGELLVTLGGNPTIERDPVFLSGADPSALLLLDVEAEDRAIAQYEDHRVRLADVPAAVQAIDRILVDERFHRGVFVDLRQKLGLSPVEAAATSPTVEPPTAAAEGWTGPAAKGPYGQGAAGEAAGVAGGETSRDRALALLSDEMQRLYGLVLSELYTGLSAGRCPVQKSLVDDHAQWHMKHLGWVAERLVEMGGEAQFIHQLSGPPSGDTAHELKLDALRAREAHERYLQHVQKIDDPEAQRVLRRMAAHEEFMRERLGTLADDESATPSRTPARETGPVRRLTVGALLGKKQE